MSETSDYMKKFMSQLTVFSVIIVALAGIFWLVSPDEIVTPALFPLIVFFYVLSLSVHFILIKSSKQKFTRFNNYFMLSTVSKLVLYMIIVITYVLKNAGDAVNFLITFLILYVLFTGFEVISIVKATKKIKSSDN